MDLNFHLQPGHQSFPYNKVIIRSPSSLPPFYLLIPAEECSTRTIIEMQWTRSIAIENRFLAYAVR